MIKYLDYYPGDKGVEISLIHPGVLEKTASYEPELQEFLQKLIPEPSRYFLLVNALGAGEFYGSNRNGDYFSEPTLMEYHKTFETLGKVYRHHRNKPKLGHRVYGEILYSHYNPIMHRVELVIGLDIKAAPDLKEQIDKGEFPPISMGSRVPYDVCFASNTKVFTENGFLAIEDLLDKKINVYSDKGLLRNVSAKIAREVNSFIKIKVFGDYESLKPTHEHPFLVAKKEQFMEGKVTRFLSFKGNLQKEWISADSLRIGDYLLHKKLEKNVDIFSIKESRLFGYYLSEGSLIKEKNKKITGLSFSFNIDEKDSYVSEILELYPNAKVYINESKNECSVKLYDQELTNKFLKYGGEYSHHKFISPEILQSSDESLFNILGTLINGDGSQDHNTQKGVIRYCTVGENLARSVRRLTLELGILSSINTNSIKTSFGKSKIYNIYIPSSFSSCISPYSTKVESYNKKISSRLREIEGYILFPILSLEEVDKHITVYNLQVEADQTYYVNDYITHNCSICGNRAPRIQDYCEHARTMMNKILSDGRKVYVDNPKPKFFDISFVRVPADRTAYTLRKVASDESIVIPSAVKTAEELKNAGIKESAIVKILEGQIEAGGPDPSRLIVDSQPNMPSKMVDDLAKSAPLNEVLSTLVAMRVMPKKAEFQKLVLIAKGQEKLAENLEKEKVVFIIQDDIEPIIPDDIGYNYLNEKVANVLKAYPEYLDRAPLTKSVVMARILEKEAMLDTGHQKGSKMEQFGEIPPLKDMPEDKMVTKSEEQIPIISPIKNPLLPLSAIGGLYYGISKLMNSVGSAEGLKAVLARNPWLLPILIGGATIGSMEIQKKFIEKTAGGLGFLSSMLLSVPATYLYAGYQEAKVRKRQPIGAYSDFVRKNPLLSSIGHGFLGSKASKLLTKVGEAKDKLFLASLELNENKFNNLYNIVIDGN